MTEQKFKRLIMPNDSSSALSGDLGDWCKEHYIMTFVLGLVALETIWCCVNTIKN